MRVVVQRCKKAQVTVNNTCLGQIDKGLVLLVGFTQNDSSQEIDYIIDKIINLRIFPDNEGIMNLSLLDVKGSILSISQFTLYANTQKGRRPSYLKALNGNLAKALYDEFNEKLKTTGLNIATGKFGADMQVELINDGPTTILLEKEH